MENTPEYSSVIVNFSITLRVEGKCVRRHHISNRHFTGTKPLFFPLVSRRKPSISSFFPTQICRGGETAMGEGGREGRRGERSIEQEEGQVTFNDVREFVD